MKLDEIARLLDCSVISGDDLLDVDIRSCFAADLMSDVLAFSRSGALLVTGLASVQSVHAADVAEFKGILFVHDKRPDPSVVAMARARGLPLLSTGRFMFETCGVLFSHGLMAAEGK